MARHFFTVRSTGFQRSRHYLGRYSDKTKGEDGKAVSLKDAIIVPCPVIIEPDQAARVAALRARRAPAVTAPSVTNRPTLLIGRIKCGVSSCERAMTIATGKGRRYRYYKCTAKANGGATPCTCPTMREEVLDDIVLSAVEQRVLDPARLKNLLSGILEISDTADARRRTDLDQARKARTRTETAVGRLLDLIETGQMLARDPVFVGRLAERRTEKARLDATIQGLERQVIRGSKRTTSDVVEQFGVMVAEKLRGKDPILRQTYVRLLVDRVEVTAAVVKITGSKAALEHAVLDQKIVAGRVPNFDREWCRLGDSNT